jgi:hypothetical protein
MPSSISEALHYIERNINNLVEEIEVGTVGALCRDMILQPKYLISNLPRQQRLYVFTPVKL